MIICCIIGTAKTLSEISDQLYNVYDRDNYHDNLLFHYGMNDGIGSTIYDASDNQNDATVMNKSLSFWVRYATPSLTHQIPHTITSLTSHIANLNCPSR